MQMTLHVNVVELTYKILPNLEPVTHILPTNGCFLDAITYSCTIDKSSYHSTLY